MKLFAPRDSPAPMPADHHHRNLHADRHHVRTEVARFLA
jgi:hypothetical protein